MKMNWILLGVGLLVGGGTGFGVTYKLVKKEEKEEPVLESSVGNKLADIDLLKLPCSKEFIAEKGNDLLCREMFCRMQQRGLDSKTSSADCSGISNMSNTLLFIKVVTEKCKIDQNDTDKYNKCYDRFNRILTTGKSGQ